MANGNGRPPPLRGLEAAPEYFVDGLQDIQFHGVNTLFIPYRTVIRPRGPVRIVPYVVRIPTGALAVMERQMFEFARDHQLLQRWNQDGTRSV